MTTNPTENTHSLSVQHADALWDAVAIPGPRTPTFAEQHERVCRAVATILAEVTPTPAASQWAVIGGIVDWLDRENGRSENQITLRMLKITEEAGEVAQAWIGSFGQNPRKGVSHTQADVQNELCDVIVTAAVALASITDQPQNVFDGRLADLAARTGVVPAVNQSAAGLPAGGTPPQPEEPRIVAYRSPLPGALSIYCTRHLDELSPYFTQLTSDDLPDGALCAKCGVDVLIPQQEA